MTDLTPDALAERRALWTELRDRGGQDVILTPEFALSLLDALAAERAAREEAEQELAHAETCWALETQRATSEKIEKETAEARAVKAEQENALLVERVGWEAHLLERADKAEQERDEARAALREARERWGRIEAAVRGDDLAAAFLAAEARVVELAKVSNERAAGRSKAEARVAALEAGINALSAKHRAEYEKQSALHDGEWGSHSYVARWQFAEELDALLAPTDPTEEN